MSSFSIIVSIVSLIFSQGGIIDIRDTVLTNDTDTLVVAPVLPSQQADSVTVVEEEVDRPAPIVFQHLAFKGIELDGSPADFGKRLEKQGFKWRQGALYTGSFAGVDGVYLLVSSDQGNVWKTTVVFPASPNWPAIKEQYLRFKGWLGWKYVVSPVMVRERLSAKFREGSCQEAWGFENGTSVYSCTFDFSEGRIVLRVAYDKASGGMCICMDYIDRINSIIKEEKDMEDL